MLTVNKERVNVQLTSMGNNLFEENVIAAIIHPISQCETLNLSLMCKKYLFSADMAYTIIRSKEQYDQYCNQLYKLVQKESSRDSNDVELLTLLTEKWEKENILSIALDPIQLIKELMQQNNMNSKELGEILELSKGTISKMLNYNKGLSKETIRKLSIRFKISQDAFNKPYRLKPEVKKNIRSASQMNAQKSLDKV